MTITVTFDCESSNDAQLLITLYDLLTHVNPEDSMSITTNFTWLFDEVLDRLEIVAEAMEGPIGGEKLEIERLREWAVIRDRVRNIQRNA